MRGRILLAALLACAAPAAGPVPSRPPPDHPWQGGNVSLVSENDKWAFRGADQHYTNGIRVGWISREVQADPGPGLEWAQRLAMAIPGLDPSGRKRIGFALGQNIYTPSDTRRTVRDPSDRPYAGWLYGGMAVINEVRTGRERRRSDLIETLEVNLGIVGPGAGGELVQNRWHGFIEVPPAAGWDNQLPTEPGALLFYERKWRSLFGFEPGRLAPAVEIDIVPHMAISLGNVATYAAAGGTFRIGNNLDVDYGPPRIRPALSGSGFQYSEDVLGLYAFAGFETRLVGYDMFLDGPLLRDAPGAVERRPLVLDAQSGFALTWRSLRIAFTYVLRTREFQGQPSADRFGAFSLTFGL